MNIGSMLDVINPVDHINSLVQPSSSANKIDSATGAFQEIMEQHSVQIDIIKRLDGVPADTVFIPPSIIEKMKTDRGTYEYVMSGIDEYVRNYKTYNKANTIDFSFHVTEKGEWFIRGKDKLVAAQCEGGEELDKSKSVLSQELTELLPPSVLGIDVNYELAMAYWYKKNAGIE